MLFSARTSGTGFGKLFAAACLALSSFSVFAFSESLQQINPQAFNTIIIAIAIIVVVLFVALLVLKNRIKSRDQKLFESDRKMSKVQEQLNRSISGIVQLSQDGKILYANRRASSFLGEKAEKMLGKPLVSFFPESTSHMLEQAFTSSEESQVQCQLGHFQRNTRIRVSPQKNAIDDIAIFVVIDDVEHYQQQIDRQKALNHHRQGAIEFAEVCSGSINFATGSVSLNQALSTLLGQSKQDEVSVDTLHDMIAANNRAEWNYFVKQLSEGQAHSFSAYVLRNETPIPVNIYGMPHNAEQEEKAAIATLIFEERSEIERLKQQAALFQTQLNTVINASPLPIYRLNNNKQIVDCNRPFCALFKIELNRIKNKSISDIEQFDEAFKQLHSGIEGIGTRHKSGRISLKDGQKIDLNLHFLSYKLGNEHAGTVAFIEDLTAIKDMEEQVAESMETLNNLIEQSPMGMAIFDQEDKLLRVNHSLTDLLGRSRENLETQTFFQLFQSPEQSGTAARLIHQHGKLENFNAAMVGQDEQVFSTRLDVAKLHGKEQQYVCWVADSRDLQYLSHQFERLFTNSNMAVGILSEEGFTQLNPAACEFFGVASEDALIGLSPASESLNVSAERAKEMQGYLEGLRNGMKISEFSWEHQHNGERLSCEISFVPIFDQHEHTATLCMWSDLRAIKQADAARLEAVNLRQMAEREMAEKQQLLQNSQDLLASRARSLQDTQEKLTAAEHDLATKMHTIQGLRQAHEDVSENLQSLQEDYQRNRQLLQQSQQVNAGLELQLQASSDKVNQLQKQRNQIADALQNSERSHKKAQEELAISEQTTRKLKEEQVAQQTSLDAAQAKIDSLKHSIEGKDKEINDVSVKINSLQSQLVSSGQVSEKLRQQLINQRKASEQAEQKRRELELTCQAAQSELANKSGYVDHLQHEMKMLERMSQQQKGDMEKQTQQLAEELAAKQSQLDQTEQQLTQARQQSEQEQQQRAARESELQQLQQEMQDVEQRSLEQQQKIAEADANWKQKQAELQQELKAKQEELQQTTERLNDTQQQTEEEKAQQAELLNKLQRELREVEQRADAQGAEIAQSDQQWREKQQAMANELAAKKAQLDSTQQQLDEHQRQVEAEKLERQAQQAKLEQLKQEMSDVESRASKQRELMEGSDEQWRQAHDEIEKQKHQLQQALVEAQEQNRQMQSTLEQKLESLKHAESTVSQTQSDEQKLQRELINAKEEADALQARLKQQEEQESRLKQQVSEQQSSLQQREDSIKALEDEQKRLTQALSSVKEEYAQSKASLENQDSSQQALNEQLRALEDELKVSKQQLTDKESALQDAQKQIATSADKLAAHEQALIEAQKEELKQNTEQQAPVDRGPEPEYAKLPMPSEPEVWFDLLPYLQHRQGVTSLASSLQELIDNLQNSVDALDKALDEDSDPQIHLSTLKLIKVLESIHSAPLNDMAKRLQMCCENRLTDNIAISWPASRNNLMTTLRVIDSHLHATH